jgi:hypothetical protein
VAPFQTHCYSENLVAPGIEPGTSGLAARNSDYQTTEVVIMQQYSKHISVAMKKYAKTEKPP